MAARAKRAFNKTLVRVDGLLALHPVIHGTTGRPKRHVSDVLRGALVLAVAALDSLVVDSVVEAVPSLARKGALGKTAGKWVKEDPRRCWLASPKPTPTPPCRLSTSRSLAKSRSNGQPPSRECCAM